MNKRTNDSIFACPITLALLLANLICFALEVYFGGSEDAEVLVAMGACYAPLVTGGQFYRLFTCLFLHFGITHLMNNMLSLGAVGSFVENRLGHIRFLLVYLAGGIFGNVASLAWDIFRARSVVSAGASGGVFALFGGITYMVIAREPQMQGIRIGRLAIALFFLLAGTFGEPDIDIAAHIGGFIGGFCCAGLLLFKLDR